MHQATTGGAIVVLGGINMDVVAIASRFPAAGETVVGESFLTYPGGKGANQAVACAMMGAETVMVGRVGDDMFGPQLLAGLTSKGVDVSRVGVSTGVSSGIAVIEIDSSAQNRIIQVLGANDTCGRDEAKSISEALDQAAALLLQLEVSLDLSLQAARDARARGKIVMLDPGPVRPLPEEFYRYCSVITPNETEAQALVGFPVTDQQSASAAARLLLGRGAEAVVIKLGSQGACYASTESEAYVSPFPVTAVDSVAAGDAFNGALAVALSQGREIGEAVRIASAAGALAVTKYGAQDSMPSLEEVESFLASQPVQWYL